MNSIAVSVTELNYISVHMFLNLYFSFASNDVMLESNFLISSVKKIPKTKLIEVGSGKILIVTDDPPLQDPSTAVLVTAGQTLGKNGETAPQNPP